MSTTETPTAAALAGVAAAAAANKRSPKLAALEANDRKNSILKAPKILVTRIFDLFLAELLDLLIVEDEKESDQEAVLYLQKTLRELKTTQESLRPALAVQADGEEE